MRRGEPLGAVAAALASPETAERIAVLEAATSGKMSSLLAARLNVARAGGDLSVLDGLHAAQTVDETAARKMAVEISARKFADAVAELEEDEGEQSILEASPEAQAERPFATAAR